MDRLFSIFNAMASGMKHARDYIADHGRKIYAGFQALESTGHSKLYHAGKTAVVCGLFITSLLTLNFEAAIATGISIGDEIGFLERLSGDSFAPKNDIS